MILAILQARMSSKRLPGKVLMKALGRPLLEVMLSRLEKSKNIDQLIVATSTDTSDEKIAQFCKNKSIPCYRGSLNDVLGRYYQCAKNYQPQHIVRVTGDCPLIDPQIVDAVISMHLKTGADYTSNTIQPTFPDGLDVEVLSFQTLEVLWKKAKLNSQREHVTKYIHDNKEKFCVQNYTAEHDFSHLRWTVDNLEDLKLIQNICKLVPSIYNANYHDILKLYKDPALQRQLNVNAHLKRNEGLQMSIEKNWDSK